jgi:hypothetical protein
MTRRIVIFKYPIASHGESLLLMPVFGKVVSVQNQRGQIVLWVEIPSQPGDHTGASGNRRFYSVLTGHHTDVPNDAVYRGTVQLSGGAYVAHVYEAKA